MLFHFTRGQFEPRLTSSKGQVLAVLVVFPAWKAEATEKVIPGCSTAATDLIPERALQILETCK